MSIYSALFVNLPLLQQFSLIYPPFNVNPTDERVSEIASSCWNPFAGVVCPQEPFYPKIPACYSEPQEDEARILQEIPDNPMGEKRPRSWEVADSTRALQRCRLDPKVKSNSFLFSYNQDISWFAKKGDLKRAEAVIEEIISRCLKPDSFSYGPIINRYAKNGDEENARRIFEWMISEGVPPNVVIYNSLINLHVQRMDADGVCRTCEEMLEAEIQPDLYTFNSLINFYVLKKDVEGANRVFQGLLAAKINPDKVTYASLLSLHVRMQDVKGAYRIYTEMRAAGVRPDRVIYGLLIDLHAFGGEIDKAEEIFKSSGIKAREIKRQGMPAVDLHSFTQGTAYLIAKEFMSRWFASSAKKCVLITGKGLHSKCEMFAMRNFISHKIKELHEEYCCYVDPNNTGRLIVEV